MFNLFECYKQYGLEHQVAWEAYRLENGLTVKINPDADPEYPLKQGAAFEFVSYAAYRPTKPMVVKDINESIRDKYQPMVKALNTNAAPQYNMYRTKIVEVIHLPRVIDLNHPDYNFDLLNFMLNQSILPAELLVFMMQEIAKR